MNYTYTFIIPHKDSPELLNRCLDSIPAREDIQIVVVDDNSRADLRPKVTRPDVEIVYIDAAHSHGAGHARNEGIRTAKGKWLLFTDSDDYYSPGFLTVLDQYKDADLDVIYFNYYHKDGETGKQFKDNRLQRTISHFEGRKEQIDLIKYRNSPPWSKMVLRQYVNAHRMYFEEVVNGNDMLFSLFVGSYSDRIAVINTRLYHYVKTPHSIGTGIHTPDKALCRITQTIKRNQFYHSIGYKKWNHSLLKTILLLLLNKNVVHKPRFILNLLKSRDVLFQNRKEWVDEIKKHSDTKDS